MTTERIKGEIAFHCDTRGCSEGIETGTKDFSEAKDTANEAGWLFRKRGDDWKHFCCRGHEEIDFSGASLATKP